MFNLTKIYREFTFYLRFEKRSLSLGINKLEIEAKITFYSIFDYIQFLDWPNHKKGRGSWVYVFQCQ
ncbi:MAG: hypothetical protein B7Z06_08260 [Flavobacteriales bacterium 32-35-8]|nr:MAG: hypothetical protein B7Z06_08260 [Flavobacteriales bacterium 32-35-8]